MLEAGAAKRERYKCVGRVSENIFAVMICNTGLYNLN